MNNSYTERERSEVEVSLKKSLGDARDNSGGLI